MQFPGAGDHKRAEGIETQMAGWGKALFDAVFGTVEGTHIHRNLMDRAKAGDRWRHWAACDIFSPDTVFIVPYSHYRNRGDVFEGATGTKGARLGYLHVQEKSPSVARCEPSYSFG